jgi:hypothetical protein
MKQVVLHPDGNAASAWGWFQKKHQKRGILQVTRVQRSKRIDIAKVFALR